MYNWQNPLFSNIIVQEKLSQQRNLFDDLLLYGQWKISFLQWFRDGRCYRYLLENFAGKCYEKIKISSAAVI